MLTTSISVDLARVGPGTSTGGFIRQYWIPGVLSSELTTNAAPLRLPLLGEKLIAFRDSAGRVGVMDHRCPHRCASLFLGRNEDGGLRCVYHGWKFDVDGNCLDLPNVTDPESSLMKKRLKASAYKAVERNGMVWVYMGPDQENPPPLPTIEVNLAAEDSTMFQMVMRDCNWLQAMEGDIDTSHFGFLHTGALDAEKIDPTHPFYSPTVNRTPQYEVIDTAWGTSYGAYRPGHDGTTYWRTANFMFPFWTQVPQGPFSEFIHARAWVPLDDEHTMMVSMSWKSGTPGEEVFGVDVMGKGYELRDNFQPQTSDWFGRWRLIENEANDWLIDRDAQASGLNYTGINNIHLQDQAVTESMGAIVDHGLEHLTTADLMIGRTRRRIANAVRSFSETGAPPPGIEHPEIFADSRSGYFYADPSVAWQQAYATNLDEAVRLGGAGGTGERAPVE